MSTNMLENSTGWYLERAFENPQVDAPFAVGAVLALSIPFDRRVLVVAHIPWEGDEWFGALLWEEGTGRYAFFRETWEELAVQAPQLLGLNEAAVQALQNNRAPTSLGFDHA